MPASAAARRIGDDSVALEALYGQFKDSALDVAEFEGMLAALSDWLQGGVVRGPCWCARPSHRVWGAPFPPSSSGSARGGELYGVPCHLYAVLSCTVGGELNPCVALHAPRAG